MSKMKEVQNKTKKKLLVLQMGRQLMLKLQFEYELWCPFTKSSGTPFTESKKVGLSFRCSGLNLASSISIISNPYFLAVCT